MRLLLINPNSATATTEMMVAMARAVGRAEIFGITATRAPRMITSPEALDASAAEVVEIGLREAPGYDGVIVAAFGDPGVAELRSNGVNVVGICEASMREAAQHGRFAVATVTPDLAQRINATAAALGLAGDYAGIWLTPGDPQALVATPALLESALEAAVLACVAEGAAQAVIIGGGPLSAAATALSGRAPVPLIAPVAAAVRLLTSPS